MDISQICIILCNPDESRNIGSACRAMANMGIKNLRIVGKKQDYDDEKVRILAIHAAYIWENAQFYSSITDATADCIISCGTTRRSGKKRKNWLMMPWEFVKHCEKNIHQGNIALIFGNERTGLTDTELQECTLGVSIPSDSDFPSLNLSHAVQIMCYEFYKSSDKIPSDITPITLNRLDKTVKTITDNQKKVGFFSITGRNEMENFWQGILARAALTEGEAQYIEKTFTKMAGLISKKKNE